MARITKASQEILDSFGFEVSTPPERDGSRRSKYDEVWQAAANFLTANPGVTIRVRTYGNASAAYAEAKAINNGEHRHFGDGSEWQAVAAKADEVDDDGKDVYAIWLTYNGS